MPDSKEILLRARSHFRAFRTVETLQKIHVPEWDLDVYYWPKMSVEEAREVRRFMRMAPGGEGLSAGALIEASVAQVVYRARDQSGVRIFSDADAEPLSTDTDSDVIRRIALEMGFSSGESLEDAEKN
jgi:hypothetical protein